MEEQSISFPYITEQQQEYIQKKTRLFNKKRKDWIGKKKPKIDHSQEVLLEEETKKLMNEFKKNYGKQASVTCMNEKGKIKQWKFRFTCIYCNNDYLNWNVHKSQCSFEKNMKKEEKEEKQIKKMKLTEEIEHELEMEMKREELKKNLPDWAKEIQQKLRKEEFISDFGEDCFIYNQNQ